MRLIDADALLEEMVGITDGWLKPHKDWRWYEDSVRNASTISNWVHAKAQESVEPILALDDGEHKLWQCGNCKIAVFTRDTKYCHNCGMAVKWK